MKRLALILFLAGSTLVSGANDPAGDMLKQAQAAATAQKYDDALHLYEQIITEHPEVMDRLWSNAQQGIATTLAAKGDLEGAAKAAHVFMDSAASWQTYDSAVMLTAGILSAIDKNVDRANQFLSFELSGTGANPLDTVGYPSQPEREKAFDTLRNRAGDNAAASRLRAFTYLYEGKPRDAFAQFADAFRRSSTSADLNRTGPDLALIGLRAVQGHRAGLGKALQFVLYGPDGPDGKAKTGDDLANPFASFSSEPPAPGKGGMAGLSQDDITSLNKVKDAALLYADDPRIRHEMRRAALSAIQRCNDALDAWGTNGQKDWYLQRAYATRDADVSGALYLGALAAARNRELNLGGTNALWAEIDAYATANGINPKEIDPARRDYKPLNNGIGKIKIQEPAYKPLKTPASYQPKPK